MTSEPVDTRQNPGLARRLRHLALLIAGPLLIAAIVMAGYLRGGRFVTTENAYVKTEILSISANVSGMVMEVSPRESQWVEAGQLLVKVDDQPYVIAVARAEAALSNVRGEIESLQAEYTNKQLEAAKAQVDLHYRETELNRIGALYENNSISGVEYDQSLYARDSADRELAEKQQALQVVKARLIDPSQPTDAHPRVKLALAELEKARLDLSHTEVRAPKAGIVVAITTHQGENVISGAPLMSLVDRNILWVEANFKETELTHMAVGQAAEISVDTYPGQTWHGHVAVITPATGAEFSLLPAQNSSGNWIKVVQRVPVMFLFDDYPGTPLLSSGMSASIRVDTGHVRSLSDLSLR